MNFYERIKHDILEDTNRRGMRENVIVNIRSLQLLLDDYEKLDSHHRAVHSMDNNNSLHYQLAHTIEALYAQNYDGEKLMLDIMEILKPKIEERIKLKQLKQLNFYYRGE